MKFITTVILFLLFTTFIFAQKDAQVLATATGKTFTASSLKPEVREGLQNLPATLAQAKKHFLENQVQNLLVENEAKSRKISSDELYKIEVRDKVPDPTDGEIQKVYRLNEKLLSGKTLDEVRPQIVAFLRRDPEQKAFEKFLAVLKTKHKVAPGKDVTAPELKPFEVLATVGERQFTVEQFKKEFDPQLYELEMTVFEAVEANLEDAVESELLVAEAVEQQTSPSEILAREIGNKMKDFSDEERESLHNALRTRLFAKYKVKFLLKEPKPIVQKVSTDGEPSKGRADAPVTIVMFSDFQCSACSAFYPVLKRVMAEYGDKIRFVVRDFPLVHIHKDAFQAAVAANAANRQGKFFEYKELLYNNQDALDEESLKKYAAAIELDIKKFEADLKDEKLADEIRQDMADGESYGISGTPTIFVNGVKISSLSEKSFRKAIGRNL